MGALPEFKLVRPRTVEEAIAAARAERSSRYLGGGTDLIVNMRRGLVDTHKLIDLTQIKELWHLSCDDSGLHMGAGVTLRDVSEHRSIRRRFRAVAEACDVIAGPGHRAAATIGGNLCLDTRCIYYNQSHWWRDANDYCLKYKGETCHVAPQGNRCRAAYCGDLAPALLVHEAEVELAGPQGRRRIALADFYEEDGADHLRLSPDEIVVAVHVTPESKNAVSASAYAKVRVRGGIDFPLAGVAVACDLDPQSGVDLKVAVTGTNSRPLIIEGVNAVARGQHLDTELGRLEKHVQKQVSPQRTTIAAADYRRLAVSALARKLAARLVGEIRAAAT